MADATGAVGSEGFTDASWAVWEPLIEAVRPRGKAPPKDLRRTMAAIFWRHQNGAKWRAIPAELGPLMPLRGISLRGIAYGDGGWQHSCSSAGPSKACGSGCWSKHKSTRAAWS